MKILLVRLRLIGDVVFTTPIIAALRARFPDAHLAYAVEPPAAPVVAHNPHLDDVIVVSRGHGLSQLQRDVALIARLRRTGFDIAVDLHGGPRASILTLLSGAPRRIGYRVAGRSWMYTDVVERPRALRPRHSVENQWDLLEVLGVAPPDPAANPVEMPVDPDARRRASDRLARAGVADGHAIVVIHVSAGNPFRRWPFAHFVDLATTLAAADARRRIVITSGPSETEAAAQVIAESRRRLAGQSAKIVDAGEWPLDELRALLDRAALYIGGDSGPLHIAATSPVPIVGLYGPTLPVRSGPWRAPALVHEAVETDGLPCRPCDQRVCAPGDFRCLTWIAPEQVAAAAERAMGREAADKMKSG